MVAKAGGMTCASGLATRYRCLLQRMVAGRQGCHVAIVSAELERGTVLVMDHQSERHDVGAIAWRPSIALLDVGCSMVHWRSKNGWYGLEPTAGAMAW